MKKIISVIIPSYNESENITLILDRLNKVSQKEPNYRFEFMFINDGSTDNTLDVLRELAKKDSRVSYINLSRNFGKEIAVAAGIDNIQGEAVIIIDADGQEPPEIIPQMIDWWEKGYDDVYARRADKKDSNIRKLLSHTYYRTLQKMTRVPIQIDTGDFRLFSKKVILALRQFRESSRQNKALFSWVGYRKKEIFYKQSSRKHGKTKWRLGLLSPGNSLINLAIDGFTSFTTLPLRFITILGILTSVITTIYIAIVVIQALIGVPRISGFNTLLIFILFLGGIQMISLGIIGEYIGRIFNETKNRPLYLIQDIHQNKQKENAGKKTVK